MTAKSEVVQAKFIATSAGRSSFWSLFVESMLKGEVGDFLALNELAPQAMVNVSTPDNH